MTLEDIGEGDDGLLCKTNLTECCRPPYTGAGSAIGNWFFPNGTRIPSSGNLNTTFHRTRDKMMVNLNRKKGGEDGIYHCEISDSVNATQTIYIGVYTTNSSIGE